MKAKASRILVNWQQLLMIRQVLMSRHIYFMAGLSSIFVPSRNEKYILTHNQAGMPLCREWPDLDGEVLFMTPGEAARTELEREFPNVSKVGWPARSVRLFDWRWPMVYTGPYQGEAVYIDLVGAYHQIYRHLWLDVCYPRGRGTLNLKPIAERLGNWKPARNSLLGVIRSRHSFGFRGGSRFRLSMGNKFLSPHLWATVQGVLNEIAFRAIGLGCVYVATDGYIFPSGSGVKRFQQFLVDFGLENRAIAGDCEIRGWGNYRIGSRQTKRFQVGQWQGNKTFISLDLPNSSEPLKLLSWWHQECKKWSRNKD